MLCCTEPTEIVAAFAHPCAANRHHCLVCPLTLFSSSASSSSPPPPCPAASSSSSSSSPSGSTCIGFLAFWLPPMASLKSPYLIEPPCIHSCIRLSAALKVLPNNIWQRPRFFAYGTTNFITLVCATLCCVCVCVCVYNIYMIYLVYIVCVYIVYIYGVYTIYVCV